MAIRCKHLTVVDPEKEQYEEEESDNKRPSNLVSGYL